MSTEIGKAFSDRDGAPIKIPEGTSELALNPDGSLVLLMGESNISRATRMIFRQGRINAGIFGHEGIPILLFRVAPYNRTNEEDLGDDLADIRSAVEINLLDFPAAYVRSLMDSTRNEIGIKAVLAETSPEGNAQHRIVAIRESRIGLPDLQDRAQRQLEKYDTAKEASQTAQDLFEKYSRREMMEKGNLWVQNEEEGQDGKLELFSLPGEPI